MIVYGKNVINEILKTPSIIKKIYINNNFNDESILMKVQKLNLNKESVDKNKLDKMCTYAVHQGIVARCQPLPQYDVMDLVDEIADKEHALVVVLDQVTDPHNIGAVLRSAAAFNACGVIIPQNGAPDETGVLAKSASGALELIPLVKVKNLTRAMQELKENGFWCIGLDGYAKHSVYQSKLPKKCVIVMGSEGDGLRRLTSENCDDTVKLPMNPAVESLNVSNACAIALYEWNRQHHTGMDK